MIASLAGLRLLLDWFSFIERKIGDRLTFCVRAIDEG
jgi:hypothetical protein